MNIALFRKYSFELLLALKTLVSLLLLWMICPPLFPDEAQYWVWSEHLDIGYYSKPPAIAWMIALSSTLLGQSEIGVRLPSLLMSALAAWFLAGAMRHLGASERSAKMSTWLFVFSPLVLYGSFAATTDVGLLLGWCAVFYFLEQPLDSNKKCGFLVFWAMWALLFKPSILLLAVASWFRFWDKDRQLKGLLIAFGCFLGGLFPLLWNLEHDFVTFRHIWTQLIGTQESGQAVTGSGLELSFKRPFELFFAQILLFSPWVSVYLVKGVLKAFKQIQKPLKWHATLALLILAFAILSSFRIKFQANWPLIAFPSLFCLLSQVNISARWVKGHAFAHSFLFLGALGIFYGQSYEWPLATYFSKNVNLFKSVQGWQEIGEKLPPTPWKGEKGFWISDRYQTCSLLSFYGPSKEVFWFNLHGARQNQFSFWAVDKKYLGAPARFVLVDSCTLQEMQRVAHLNVDKLKPYFERVVQVQVVPLWTYQGKVQRSVLIVDLEGYLGSRPQDPHQF